MDELVPEIVVCPGCEREVPSDAVYCPYCCGKDGRGGARRRAAFIGAIGGVMLGGIVAAIGSSIVGPERATWGVTFGIVAACVIAGMIWGMLRQRGQ